MPSLRDQIGELEAEVNELKKEVAQSRETVEVLTNPPRWEPQGNAVLGFMKQLLQHEVDEQGRKTRLKQFEEAIARSEAALKQKEAELAELQQREATISTEIFDAGRQLSEEVEAHLQAIERAIASYKELQGKYGSEMPVFSNTYSDLREFMENAPAIAVRNGKISLLPQRHEIAARAQIKQREYEESKQRFAQPAGKLPEKAIA